MCALVLVSAAAAACSDSPAGPTPASLSISAISPASGSITGGTPVAITGKGFASGATVTIAGAPATSVAVQSAELLTAVTPVAAAGAADVVVSSGGGMATLTRGFTFITPSGANQAPVVSGIRSIGSRPNQPNGLADLDETITLVATVTDVETPLSALTYTWSGAGTFSGTGATVSWRAPATLSSVPSALTLTLNVAESYTEGGVTHKNSASGAFVAQLHDSQKEILEMGEDFLTLFSRSEVPTDQVLHNFSATCDGGAGRANEASDVDRNRRDFIEDFSKFRITRLPPVTFNFGGFCSNPKGPRRADACSQFAVHWEVTYKNPPDTGKHETADGIDYVTAVFENNRWYLCHSDFAGTVTNPLTGVRRYVTW